MFGHLVDTPTVARRTLFCEHLRVELTAALTDLGIALGLGMLVGLQREKVDSPLAGVRTFPIVTVLGTLCAFISSSFGPWFLAASFLAVALLIVVGSAASAIRTADIGMTTEMALLMMFGVGCYLVIGHTEVAIAIGGGVAVLLQAKQQLQRIIGRLGDDDVRAIMQFALISLVILPILPNQTYGPFDVLNPREIWLMVVLIVGLSLGGYLVFRFWGQNAGTVLSGILGGLISSTATTFSYARRSAHGDGQARAASIIIMIASTIVAIRVAVEVAVVAPQIIGRVIVPLAILFVAHVAACVALWLAGKDEQLEILPQENPTELKPALIFAALYAGVLLAVAAAKVYIGNQGLYVVAGISGLTDVDALTLSASQLARDGRLTADQAWRMIVVAAVSNLVFKAIVMRVVGSASLFRRILPPFAFAALCGVLLVLFYPTIS